MKSILQSEKECYITRRTDSLEEHHIFYGAGRRTLSEKYGLKVWITHDWHNEPPNGVHFDNSLRSALEKIGQVTFQKVYPDLDFIKIFGKNYL